jgi:hypothetical protein
MESTKRSATKTLAPSDDRIREIAHSIWLQEGCPEGCSEEHWHRAVEMAKAELAPSKAAKPAKKAAKAPAKKTGTRKSA